MKRTKQSSPVQLTAENHALIEAIVQDSNNPLLTMNRAANYAVTYGAEKVRKMFVKTKNK